jgi:hypothetical protein
MASITNVTVPPMSGSTAPLAVTVLSLWFGGQSVVMSSVTLEQSGGALIHSFVAVSITVSSGSWIPSPSLSRNAVIVSVPGLVPVYVNVAAPAMSVTAEPEVGFAPVTVKTTSLPSSGNGAGQHRRRDRVRRADRVARAVGCERQHRVDLLSPGRAVVVGEDETQPVEEHSGVEDGVALILDAQNERVHGSADDRSRSLQQARRPVIRRSRVRILV